MSETPDRLREHLVPGESLAAVHAAALSEGAVWREVSVGLTDRRLVCVAEDGTFVAVGYGSVCAVRSRRRTTSTYRGYDYRLLAGGGLLLAVLGLLATVALATVALVPLLVLSAVAGLGSAAHLRRTADDADWVGAEEVAARIGCGFENWDDLSEYAYRVAARAGERQRLSAGFGVVGAASLLGAAAVASTPLAVLAALPTIGGLGLAEYARRHRTEFDGIEVVRRCEREIRVSIDGGRVLQIRADPEAGIGRAIGRLAFVGDADPVPVVPGRS